VSGRTEIGVIYDPNADLLYSTPTGAGRTAQRRAHPREPDDGSRARDRRHRVLAADKDRRLRIDRDSPAATRRQRHPKRVGGAWARARRRRPARRLRGAPSLRVGRACRIVLVEEAGGRVNAFLTRVSGVLGLGMTLTVAPRPACTNWSWMTRLASPSSVTGPPPGKLSRSHRQRAEEGECVAKQRADRDRSPDPRIRR